MIRNFSLSHDHNQVRNKNFFSISNLKHMLSKNKQFTYDIFCQIYNLLKFCLQKYVNQLKFYKITYNSFESISLKYYTQYLYILET